MREYPRLFRGYEFTLETNEDICLHDLKHEQLDMKEGDTFVVTKSVKGEIVLKKVNHTQ